MGMTSRIFSISVFNETNTHLHVVYETAEGERREENFVKPQYGALGLAFETVSYG